MEQDQKISVSAQDLIAVLAHSGSVKRAREFAKENNFSKKRSARSVKRSQIQTYRMH